MLALVREITALHALAGNHAFAIELGEGSYRCFHLFGGRFRAGGRVEYAISAGVVLAFLILQADKALRRSFTIGLACMSKV